MRGEGQGFEIFEDLEGVCVSNVSDIDIISKVHS
jgi:hypothetical protein